MILSTILKEKARIEYMLLKYREEYESLPKGAISEKKVGDKTYYYLKYRSGKKVISQYINKATVNEIKVQIERRKHIEIMIKSLQEELNIANRALEEKWWFYITEAIWQSPVLS